jgi:ketosteroid isomerase-like protein
MMRSPEKKETSILKLSHLSKILLAATLAFAGACNTKGDDNAGAPPPPTPEERLAAATKKRAPAEKPQTNTTEAVLDRHLQAFGAGNLDGILADYADDAVIVTPMGTLKGKEALKPLYVGFFTEFAKPGVKFEMGKKMTNGNLAYITWSGETADNVYHAATDTFVIVNGKITHQTLAAKITAKNPPAKKEEKAKAPELTDGPTKTVLMNHLDAFGKKDMAQILGDFTPETVGFGPMGELAGLDKFKGVFEGLFAEFSKPKTEFTMEFMTVEGDIALIVWSADTADNTWEWATDTFVVRDNKILYQTLHAKVTPKK